MRNTMRFLSLYKPDGVWVMLGILLSLIALVSGMTLLGVSGWFITAMGLAGIAATSMNYFTPAAIIRALSIIRTSGRYAERMVNHDSALRVTARFRQWFYDRLETLPSATLQDFRHGDVFSRLRGDIDTLERVYLNGVVPLCSGLLAIIGVGIVFFFYGWAFAVLQTGLLLIAGLGLPVFLQRASISDQVRMDILMRNTRIHVADTLQAMGEFLVYNGAGCIQEDLDQRADEVLFIQNRFNQRESFLQAIIVLITGLSVIGAVILILPLIQNGLLEPAQSGLIPLLCIACFDAAILLPPAIRALHMAGGATDRIFSLADKTSPSQTGRGMVSNASFSLAVKNLTFSYGKKTDISDFSFSLHAGEVLFITGPSGSGKSTVINLLMGLWQPQSGMITLNSHDILDYDPESLRSCFSVAPQKPYIFADTIAANLRIADPSASVQKLDEVCTIVGLSKLISELPAGYDTFLGENGLRLSGGQIRRLSLARALLKPAQCLILDEPTEGLDEASAEIVIKSILVYARSNERAVIICQHNSKQEIECHAGLHGFVHTFE